MHIKTFVEAFPHAPIPGGYLKLITGLETHGARVIKSGNPFSFEFCNQ